VTTSRLASRIWRAALRLAVPLALLRPSAARASDEPAVLMFFLNHAENGEVQVVLRKERRPSSSSAPVLIACAALSGIADILVKVLSL
jgi:hypothetical protein